MMRIANSNIRRFTYLVLFAGLLGACAPMSGGGNLSLADRSGGSYYDAVPLIPEEHRDQ